MRLLLAIGIVVGDAYNYTYVIRRESCTFRINESLLLTAKILRIIM